MMVNENGKFLNCKPDQEPKLLLIKPTLLDNMMRLDAPGMDTIMIPLDPDKHKDGKIINIK